MTHCYVNSISTRKREREKEERREERVEMQIVDRVS